MNLPPSIVLVTVDCLRADHCGFLGYDRPTTPFLDSLAEESLVFRNAVAAGAPTYYAFPAIMASRFPLALGRDVAGLAPGEGTLPLALNGAGYKTAAFLAGNPYLSRRYGYDSGFDEFEDYLKEQLAPTSPPRPADETWRSRFNQRVRSTCQRFGPARRIYDEFNFRHHMRGAGRTTASFDQLRRYPAANVVVDRARQWLGSIGRQPFFLWLHLMDPHGPYLPPAEALAMMGQPQFPPARAHFLNEFWAWPELSERRLLRHREEVVLLYDAGIRWVDAQMAVLVDALRQSGAWQNCVFAFTADHGEEFLEHGNISHYPKLTEELIHVPLVLHGPSVRAARAETPFSLVHLAPTLLDAAGLPAPETFRGISHWTRLDDEQSWKSPAISECIWRNPFWTKLPPTERTLALRESNFKLVLDFRRGTEETFDLAADPRELHSLPLDAQKPLRRRLLEQAQLHLADSTAAADPGLRLSASIRELRMKYAALN
ncbi:MAG TPA: sulfatase [Terriglobales bacterium]|nr:sulfatase [Terriglobales bacterium]